MLVLPAESKNSNVAFNAFSRRNFFASPLS
jgi:hypothetical protein